MTEIKYHLSNNVPKRCYAEERKCPVGGQHYGSPEDYYKELEETSPIFTKLSKKKKTEEDYRNHDMQIAKVLTAIDNEQRAFELSILSIKRDLRHNYNFYSFKDYVNFVENYINDNGAERWRVASLERELAKVKQNYKNIVRLERVLEEKDSYYDGWNRYFFVPGGHIHSSRSCSTCNKSPLRPTRFSWLPEISGKSIEDAIKAYDSTLCTVCYPDAPVKFLEKKVDETICAGSGTRNYTQKRPNYISRYESCNVCNKKVAITPSDLLRKHKK